MSEPAAPTPTRPRSDLDLARIGLVGAIFLIPLEVAVVLAEREGLATGYNGLVTAFAFDLPLAMLLVAALPRTVQRIRRRDLPLGLLTGLALAAFALLAFVFHPSAVGAMFVLRLTALVVVAAEIIGLDAATFRARVAGPLLVAGSLQGIIGIFQVINGGPLGLGGLGERSRFVFFGDTAAAHGTTLHPYVLAGFSILAVTVGIATLPDDARRRAWLAGIALSAMPIGITYSRSAAVGFVVALVALVVAAVRKPERYRAATVAVAAGALIPALVFSGGWQVRIDESTEADLNENSSNRLVHIEQSFDVISESPIVGVGPGNYTAVLETLDFTVPDVVHFVPLLIAAEDGVIAGGVISILLALLAWRALRTSPFAFALLAGLGAMLIFDKFPYYHPNGLMMLAVWLAVLDRVAAREPAAVG